MERAASLLSSALVLGVIITATILAALLSAPLSAKVNQTQTYVPYNIPTATNSTNLSVRLSFPDGVVFGQGGVYAGTYRGAFQQGIYVFDNIPPGTYTLNLNDSAATYLPPTSVKVVAGANYLGLTVYELQVVHVVESPNFQLNASSPGPTIYAGNGTAVRLVISNNTTLIQNLAVVQSLYNSNYSNVLFGSLSSTVSAGGIVNDTVIVTRPGQFYYECLIGTDARAGEWGNFTVLQA